MAQAIPARTTNGSGEVDELLGDRLYLGPTGSGKSVTIGEDIATLLESDRDVRVIDIVEHDEYDRPELRNEYGLTIPGRFTIDEALAKSSLFTAELTEVVLHQDYTRLAVDHTLPPTERSRLVQHYLGMAQAAASHVPEDVVIVCDAKADDLSNEEFVERALGGGGTPVWLADVYPVYGITGTWLFHSPEGQIVLHSLPHTRRVREKLGDSLRLQEKDKQFVESSTKNGERTVLVGRPGDLDWRRVRHVSNLEELRSR